jgi:hypothetical protein
MFPGLKIRYTHCIYVVRKVFLLTIGGTIHLAVSNRCFPSKAIALWLRLDESQRLALVANYLHFSEFKAIEVVDVVEGRAVGRWEGEWGVNDPLWVVRGRKP